MTRHTHCTACHFTYAFQILRTNVNNHHQPSVRKTCPILFLSPYLLPFPPLLPFPHALFYSFISLHSPFYRNSDPLLGNSISLFSCKTEFFTRCSIHCMHTTDKQIDTHTHTCTHTHTHTHTHMHTHKSILAVMHIITI